MIAAAVESPVLPFWRRRGQVNTDFLDVTDIARASGFTQQVLMSDMVFESCVAWDGKDSYLQCQQDPKMRLEVVLWMAASVARITRDGEAEFEVFRVPRDGVSREAQRVRLCITLTLFPRRVVIHMPDEKVTLVDPMKEG